MRITDISHCRVSGVSRVQANVVWEDVDRPTATIFIETDTAFQRWLRADPNVFLAACVLPAWHVGERRVKVDGCLCPVLRDGLLTSLSFLSKWYPSKHQFPFVEATSGFRTQCPVAPYAGAFLSCGIDSLSTLRLNKLYFPGGHPSSIKAAILINYLGIVSDDETAERFRGRMSRANAVCQDVGIELLPVTTNIRCLKPEMDFWMKIYHGAVLASVATAFSAQLSKVYIASTFDAYHLAPWGSHPLLDSYYSSAHLQIEHHGLHMSRFEKTTLVADWDAGLQNIQVCVNRRSRGNNCGECEKCIRTMAALTALGKLQSTVAFPHDDLSPEQIRSVRIDKDRYQLACYAELRPKFEEIGRHDLAAAIATLIC